MSAKQFYIETYGCEMNKSDSIDIALSFEAHGYVRANDEYEADIVVINTCSVRENAEERIYGRLGYYRSLNTRKEGKLLLVFAGCMAQELGDTVRDLFPEIKVIAGTYNFLNIPRAVQEYEQNNRPIVMIDKKQYNFSPFKDTRAEGHSAWVNIIKGCSNFCSYCIVPYLRGSEESKASEAVMDEISQLAARGVVEITLLGQNVNGYGNDSGDISFIELLEKINTVKNIRWIRFLTSHPKDFSTLTVQRIAELDKVCRHFHLPLQSGSDRILRLMNRRYTVKEYRELIDTVRACIPDVAITTDIIVGFPTESELDFRLTLDTVRQIGFDDAFTYRYSARPFTKALKLSGREEAETAKRRLEELISLQREMSNQKNSEEIGKCVQALVVRQSKKNEDELLCKTEKNKMVVVKTNESAGSFIPVKIVGISGNTLRGVEEKKAVERV
jgi:tRNA-2-methylthio-N6-dimethylallyladenosine synthase